MRSLLDSRKKKSSVILCFGDVVYSHENPPKGVSIPVGETYTAIEGSKGELGFFIVSNGSGHPYKMKIRSSSSANLQCLSELIEGSMLADVVIAIGSLDPIMGEVDK